MSLEGILFEYFENERVNHGTGCSAPIKICQNREYIGISTLIESPVVSFSGAEGVLFHDIVDRCAER